LWERTSMKLAAVSLTKTRPPSANMPVRAEAWGISKKPPITDSRLGVDSPKSDRLREGRWHLILLQPEDHRRALPRRGADWGPTPSYDLSRHGRFKPAQVPSGEPSWERPQRYLIAILIPNVDHSLPGLAPRKLITPDLGRAPSGPMFGSIGAIEPTPLSGVTSPSSITSKKKRGMGSSGRSYKPMGRPLVRGSKTALSKTSPAELGMPFSGTPAT
jgi:hypothetical protein